VSDQTQQAEQQTEQKPPGQKEEHFDELDVIGGVLFKFLKYFFTFYRKFFKSQQYQ